MLYYGKHRGGTYGSAVFSQIGGWALGLALFGFIVPGINNWGHGGGMAAGFLLAMLLGYRERTRETIYHKIFAVVCMIINRIDPLLERRQRPALYSSRTLNKHLNQ